MSSCPPIAHLYILLGRINASSINDLEQVIDEGAQLDCVFPGVFVGNVMVGGIPKGLHDTPADVADALVLIIVVRSSQNGFCQISAEGFINQASANPILAQIRVS